jgi:phosphopantothenoylcysteine decarboxylase / phosphopantothenate---cysteine ligase
VRLLVTAGPTREPIDPVRFISNRSSGKMGYAIAAAAIEAGHRVTLISGPVCLVPPREAEFVAVSTSDEMLEAVLRHSRECDVLVMCAAVADYKPATVASSKIKKSDENLSINLVPARDILGSLPRDNRQFLAVGFAAETEEIAKNARQKLHAKNLDMIVANDVSSANFGMESDENEVTVLFRNGKFEKIARAPKKKIAYELVKIFANMCEKCLTKKM